MDHTQKRIDELNKMITDATIKMSDFINGITSTTYGQLFEWGKERDALIK